MARKIFRMARGALKAAGGGLADWVRILRRELRKPGYRAHVGSWLKFFALATGAAVLAVAMVFGYFALSLPPLESLERLNPGHITRVTGKDSALVHEFYIQRRIWMPEEKMPERLKQAVIAVEDRSFREHWGVDLTAYPSALLPAVFGGRARGASTLTQQLAKNLFLTPERSVGRKAREILLALRIERNYTKQEILEFYFNHVYLGAGAYGFVSAAERYFSLPLDSLTVDQYALLAGLLQRPESYRPDAYPDAARDRRNVVLGAMRRAGFITREEHRDAVRAPLGTRVYRAPSDLGAYFIEHVRQFLSHRWGDEFVYNLGGSVEVTMDSALQRVADSALRARVGEIRTRMRVRTASAYHLPRLLGVSQDSLLRDWDRLYARFEKEHLTGDPEWVEQRFPPEFRYRKPQAALLVIENATGAVRVMVGGEDFAVSKYNRAVQAIRSPGSSFKPFVYATAVERGGGPGDILNDQPISIPEPGDTAKVWEPTNFEPGFEGRMTMRRAFYRSQNLPAVEVALKYGLENVVDLARRAGFRHRVNPVPSLALGSSDATLLELTSAYTIFPNGGWRAIPYFVERVRDRSGKELYSHSPRREEVLAPEVAWIVTSMLRDVNIRGTGASVWASGFRHPSGGKTGTTNGFTDAWYVGFTKRYTAGVWVGHDDHAPMGPGNTGSANGIPLWLDVMRAASVGSPMQDFPRPPGVEEVQLCPLSGHRARFFCPAPITEYVVAGHEPRSCLPWHHGDGPARGDDPPPEVEEEPRPEAPAPRREDPRLRRTF